MYYLCSHTAQLICSFVYSYTKSRFSQVFSWRGCNGVPKSDLIQSDEYIFNVIFNRKAPKKQTTNGKTFNINCIMLKNQRLDGTVDPDDHYEPSHLDLQCNSAIVVFGAVRVNGKNILTN